MPLSPSSRHLAQMTAAVMAVFIAMILATLLIDPYRVFGITGWNSKNFMPNTRYLQIEALKTRQAEAFILGTSRVNYYAVEDFQRITGLKAYNITTPGSTLRETRMQLEWLLRHQKPKMILLGLDYDIQFLVPPLTTDYLNKWMHPETTGMPLWRFRLEYLRFDVESTLLALKRNFEWKITYLFDPETGHYSLPKRDEDIQKDWAAYEASQFHPMPPKPQKADAAHDEDLRQIVALLKKHDVPVRFVINPLHHMTLASFDREDFEAWKKRVQTICGEVHDFSADPTVTGQNRLFYEPVHFNAEAGRRVLEQIYPGTAGKK